MEKLSFIPDTLIFTPNVTIPADIYIWKLADIRRQQKSVFMCCGAKACFMTDGSMQTISQSLMSALNY